MTGTTYPLRLLVVEDNPGDFLLLKEYLDQSELKVNGVLHAENMAAVPSMLNNNFPLDLALLDLTLPDSLGIDSVITLGRLLPGAPIVVFSGLSDINVALEAISLGAQDYLIKGEFDEKLLAKSIKYSIERKKILQNLKESNERYEYVNKATNDIIWEWNYNTRSGIWGQGFIKTFGYTDVNLHYNETWIQKYIHPDDIDRIVKSLQLHVHSRNEIWQDEYRFRSADGSYKHILDRAYTIFDSNHKPYRMIGAMTDITERREKEETIRKLFQAIEQSDEIILITNTDGIITFVNTAFEEVYGYKKEEIIGKNTPRILKSGMMNAEFYNELWEKLPLGKGLRKEIINKTKDGRLITIDTSLSPIYNDQQVLIGYMAVQKDITQKKNAEKNLADAELRYRTLFEQSPDGISVIDAETLLPIEFNTKIHSQLGYSREEFALLKITDYEMIDTADIIKARAEKIMQFGEYSFETKHRTKNGDIRDVQVTVRKITLNEKLLFYTIYRDITEKRKLEQQLKQQELLRQREITEATISAQEKERNDLGRELHDNINQILATVKMYLGMAKSKENPPKDLVDRSYEYVSEAIEEIRKLSKSLVSPSLGDIGLQPALEELVNEMNKIAGYKIKLLYAIGSRVPLHKDKEVMLYRIVQEQLNNISKYASAKTVTLQFDADSDFLYLSVADDGVGFDPAQKAKGIGLKNIQSRVEFYSGTVQIISAPGQGCRLEISIPR
ncbi:MAG TPA: PAS domain S-box protein [Chitinophagaceae bacterium]|jgi:PAS domain S-box-containing protein|nr:PAS domain S-box protein [Chitinophagaceae bacterium]